MANDWIISVELVRQWRWRCVAERLVVPGSALCLADSGDGHLVPLADTAADIVARESLRHACGSEVIPVTPLQVD